MHTHCIGTAGERQHVDVGRKKGNLDGRRDHFEDALVLYELVLLGFSENQ